MATSEYENSEKLDALNANLVRIEGLTQRLIAAFANKQPQRSELQSPDAGLYLRAVSAYAADMVNNPSKIMEQQVSYWGRTLQHFVEAQEALRGGKLAAPEDHTPRRQAVHQPDVENQSVFQLHQAAIPDVQSGDRDRDRRVEHAGPARKAAAGVLWQADHRHDGADELSGHQPRCADEGGRNRGRKPGQGAGKPGGRHRGQSRRVAGHAVRQGRVQGWRQHRHRRGRRGVSQPPVRTRSIQADHRTGPRDTRC